MRPHVDVSTGVVASVVKLQTGEETDGACVLWYTTFQ